MNESLGIRVEIEVRGPLGPEEFKKFQEKLQKYGNYIGYFNRFLIDYTTPVEGLEKRKLDVRVRVTNGEPELIAKVGKWAGRGREEVSVKLTEGQLINSIRYLNLLGDFLDCSGYFKKGVACARKIWCYMYKDVEFSLVEVVKLEDNFEEKRGYSFFFEAEKSVARAEKDKAFRHVISTVLELRLKLFYSEELAKELRNMGIDPNDVMTEENFYEYIAMLNEDANILLNAKDFDPVKVGRMGLKEMSLDTR